MAPKLPLPRGWKRRVRSSVLHVLALGLQPTRTRLSRSLALQSRVRDWSLLALQTFVDQHSPGASLKVAFGFCEELYFCALRTICFVGSE